jgi:trans-4-hydroxy-L-proline dehydratase
MSVTIHDTPSPAALWSPARSLSPRVQQLRAQYWDFYRRDYRNEVRSYTTGTPWDQVYAPWNWTNVPEMMIFFEGAKTYLLAAATRVDLPAGFWDEPLVVRRALFFREVAARHLPVQILDGERVVGSHFSTALSRTLKRGEARRFARLEKRFLEQVTRLDRLGVGNCGAVPGHLIPDYPQVLQRGWQAIQAEADAIAADGGQPAAKRDLARAISICAEGVRTFGERYAHEAERLASREADPARREELEQIAAICRTVPWEPARTFVEALQSLWLTHILLLIAESYPGPGVSPGRIDQYLWPYYRADLEAGRLSRDQAREWLQCLWIKHNYAYDYQGWVGTNQGINASFGQLITLGGIDEQGRDASNDLTYLILDVIEEMNLLEPKPNVRLHTGTPDRLLDRVVDMVAGAQGSPFLLNFDEKSMAGLRWQGLPEADLWDYAPVGCLENTLQGCDRSGTVDVNLNLAKAVELALHDGRDAASGEQVGPLTGPRKPLPPSTSSSRPSRLSSWPCWISSSRPTTWPTPAGPATSPPPTSARWSRAAWKGAWTSPPAAPGTTTSRSRASPWPPWPTASQPSRSWSTTSARSPMAELLQALDANFEGHEALRQTLLQRAPKYGNDHDEADGSPARSAASGHRKRSSAWRPRRASGTAAATCPGTTGFPTRPRRPPRRTGASEASS